MTTATNATNNATPEEIAADIAASKAAHNENVRAAFDGTASKALRDGVTYENEVKQAAKAGKAYGDKLARDVLKARVKIVCKSTMALVKDEAQAMIDAFLAESTDSVQ